MSSVVIGGTRGIGYALSCQLLSQKLMSRVVVTGRNQPESLPDGMLFVKMDLAAPEEELVAACDEVRRHAGDAHEALFLVAATDAVGGKWNKTRASEMVHSFQVNVVGPMIVAQQLVPNLQQGERKLLVALSAASASIASNTAGGAAAYKCTKAAVNMWNKGFAAEVPSVKTVLYHPGIVQTDLLATAFYGGKKAKETAATNKVFARLKTSETAALELITICMGPDVKSGHFYDFSGKELPW